LNRLKLDRAYEGCAAPGQVGRRQRALHRQHGLELSNGFEFSNVELLPGLAGIVAAKLTEGDDALEPLNVSFPIAQPFKRFIAEEITSTTESESRRRLR
jgi:hypothetical protein